MLNSKHIAARWSSLFMAAALLAAMLGGLATSPLASAASPLGQKAEPGSLATPEVTPAGTTSGQMLRIGATISDSGALADFGIQVRRGLTMWQAEVNERGGLLGRAVELVLLDDESSPATAARLYKQMAADGIQLFVSPYSSEITIAVRDALGATDIAMVVIASAPQIWDRPDPRLFGAYTPANHNMDPFLELVANHSLSRVALAWQDAEFPRAVALGARTKAQSLGLNIVADESYAPGTTDFTALAARLQASAPEAIIVGSYLQDAIDFSKAARKVGLKSKLIAFSGGPALREYGDAVGADTAQGVISTVQWLRSVRMPGSFDFGFRYRQQFAIYPSYDAAGGYAAGQILESAMRLAKSNDPAEVRAQLGSMKFRSIIGHYRVDDRGMQQAKNNYLVQWQDNHISLVYPPQLARWQVLYPLPW